MEVEGIGIDVYEYWNRMNREGEWMENVPDSVSDMAIVISCDDVLRVMVQDTYRSF